MADKIAIITDSCSDVPKELIEKYNIFMLPMLITCEDGQYKDGVDITVEEVYEKIKTEVPKTSSPQGEDVLDIFDKIKEQGYNKAIMIMLSSGLSGTYGFMKMLADDEEELEVEVYDSLQASIGIGIIAIQAAEYAAQGMDFDTLKKKVEQLIDGTKVFFCIQDLDLLQKGGRIGKATAFLGSVLNIKPILSFDDNDGEIYAAAKVRGMKQTLATLIKLVDEYKVEGKKYNIVICGGGVPELRAELEGMVNEHFPDYNMLVRADLGGALAVYLGFGLVGAGIQVLED
ncbi:MAG: DegV family protein [Lachnospiraceae bacterium]|nr:DegV family protein [Lachnospiraceae bacterium]